MIKPKIANIVIFRSDKFSKDIFGEPPITKVPISAIDAIRFFCSANPIFDASSYATFKPPSVPASHQSQSDDLIYLDMLPSSHQTICEK